jgi:hypothetical protein
LKNDVNALSKRNKLKNLKRKKKYFLLVSLTKRAGSGAGSVSQRYSTDPMIRIRTKMSRMEHWCNYKGRISVGYYRAMPKEVLGTVAEKKLNSGKKRRYFTPCVNC